jgi:hypothetical protein
MGRRITAFVVLNACLLSVAGTASGEGIGEEAKKHFQAGVALLQDPDGEKVEDAYRQFKTAYDLSQSPKVLGNIALCAMKIERDGEAIDAYTRYLREVPDIDTDERAQIVRDLQTLTVGVARITLRIDRPGARVVDVRIPVRGDRITNVYPNIANSVDLGLRPGHHLVSVRVDGYDEAVWETDVYAGGREQHDFSLHPKTASQQAHATAPEPQSRNLGPIVGLGVAGAMLLTGAVTGVIALGKTNDIQARCANDACTRTFDLEAARASAKTFVRATDVLLAAGAVVSLGSLTWLYFAYKKDANKTARSLPDASCGPLGCNLTYQGQF